MTVQASSSSLERELEYRKKLTGITNQINAAESIPHILMTLKDKILELLDAEFEGAYREYYGDFAYYPGDLPT